MEIEDTMREWHLLEGIATCFVNKEGFDCRTVYIAGESRFTVRKLLSFEDEYKRVNPADKVMHIKGYDFLNTIEKCIHVGISPMHYSRLFYNCDLLIMECFDAMPGNGMDGELFYTIFDHIYERGGRIVVSGKELPKDMPKLANRVRTQLEGGVIISL